MEIKLLTVKEVAKLLKKTEPFVRRQIHIRKLKATRVGVELRVQETDLQDYLMANASSGPVACRKPTRKRA